MVVKQKIHDVDPSGAHKALNNSTIAQMLVKLAIEHKERCDDPECKISIIQVREMVKFLVGYDPEEPMLKKLGF